MTKKLHAYWVFLQAIEEKSISAAARKLGISQPAASTLIRGLERDIGVKLLERRPRGVCASPSGKRVLEQVRKVFLELEELESMLLSSKTLRGRVTLGASHTPGVYWLPLRLATFRELHPQVEVSYSLAGSGELMGAVKQGRLSQAIVGEARGLSHETELQSTSLASDKLSLVGLPHLLDTRKDKNWALPLFWRERGSSARGFTEEKFPQVLDVFPHRIELPSNEAIKEAILGGLGFAVLSSWSITRELESGVLVELPGFPSEKSRSFHLIRRRETPLLQADLALWNFLNCEGGMAAC